MHVNMLEAGFGGAVAMAASLIAAGVSVPAGKLTLPPAPTVAISRTVVDYPYPGEFLAGGRPVTAPVERIEVPAFRIMTHQVSLADYDRCVAGDACNPSDARQTSDAVPITGVNWLDAEAYAKWYSQATGQSWRLPTALEAAAAAAERFGGESFSAAVDDPTNPAVRWIRRYREEAAAKRPADPEAKPRGHYGPNSKGIGDFGGNVWEWTSTCYRRVTLDVESKDIIDIVENCGVHVLEGRHRAYMSNFVRDGKSGGCAVGTPPENLGFRLVLEETDVPGLAWLGERLSSFLPSFGTADS
jgi:formylglycine-generating enzyme required for sulfatase activity